MLRKCSLPTTHAHTHTHTQEYPDAKVTGTDLSPHFLAVAELEERCASFAQNTWSCEAEDLIGGHKRTHTHTHTHC